MIFPTSSCGEACCDFVTNMNKGFAKEENTKEVILMQKETWMAEDGED